MGEDRRTTISPEALRGEMSCGSAAPGESVTVAITPVVETSAVGISALGPRVAGGRTASGTTGKDVGERFPSRGAAPKPGSVVGRVSALSLGPDSA